jgi:hypothetical protein
MHSSQVAAGAHVVEVECVGAREVGVDGRARRLERCMRRRGEGGRVDQDRVWDLKEQPCSACEGRKRGQ